MTEPEVFTTLHSSIRLSARHPLILAKSALLASAMLLACGSGSTPPLADDGRHTEVANAGAGGASAALDSGPGSDVIPWEEVAPTLAHVSGGDVEVVEGGDVAKELLPLPFTLLLASFGEEGAGDFRGMLDVLELALGLDGNGCGGFQVGDPLLAVALVDEAAGLLSLRDSITHILHRTLRGTLPFAVSARGLVITDREGREYIDACGGAAVSCLGHGHPDVIAAMHAQIDRLAYAHTSFFTTEVAEELAETLVADAPAGMSNVYLVSGGSEAMEAALKMARQYFVETGEPGRSVFIGLSALDPLQASKLAPLVRRVTAGLPGTVTVAKQSSLFEQGPTRKAWEMMSPGRSCQP